jgi:signal peptidase I
MVDFPQNQSQETSFGRVALQYALEALRVIVLAVVIVLPVRYFLIQPFNVVGASMQPNFENSDYLIIDELSYRFHEPVRGEVVVFHPPGNRGQDYIKRVIGLPGETVIVQNGTVRIVNAEHPEGYTLDETAYLGDANTPGNTQVTLRNGEYFLMGDNRAVSLDSRSFGAVPRTNVIGRVWLRGLPIEKIGTIPLPAYMTP